VRLSERSGTFLPTPAQHHLLRAALLDDRDAVRASLAEWSARVDLDDVDFGSLRLLPLLYSNLRRHDLGHPAMPRLRGLYRKSWLRNQIVLERGLRAVRALGDAGIPTLLLKGSALAATAYADPAQRPMDDLDVLVPGADFTRAVEILDATGWRTIHPIADRESYFTFRHAVAFRDGPGDLDLHKSPFRESFPRDCERELWAAAVPATLAGQDVRVLAPPDQLVQLCAHAAVRNTNVPPIRWVADAWFLLASAGPSFDWDRAVRQARLLSYSLLLLRCLEYLRDGLGVAVPPDTLRALRRRSTLANRLALRLANAEGRAIYGHIGMLWLRIAFAGSLAEVPRRLRRLPSFARTYFGLAPDVTITRFVKTRLFKTP
jgi:putative nucleotidyltransferase-like protein